MKAEERHELQQNDLVGGMAGLYMFIRKYGIYVLLAVAIFVLIIELIELHKANEQRKIEEAAMALQQAQTPRQIQNTVLNAYKVPAIAAQAYVRIGDFYLNLISLGNPAKGIGKVKATKAQSIAAAETAFHAVINKYPSQKLAVARAELGLALTYENAGQWNKAAAIYKTFTSPQASAIEKSFAPLAQYRLSHLQQWAQPVLVGPAQSQPATTAPATTAPATKPTAIRPAK
jgi:tetratricopeptide (TPR) repeat protein